MSFNGPLFLKIPVSDMMGNEDISQEAALIYNIYAICGLTIITEARAISYNSMIKLILILKRGITCKHNQGF